MFKSGLLYFNIAIYRCRYAATLIILNTSMLSNVNIICYVLFSGTIFSLKISIICILQ